MTNINCSEKCIHQKDGKCALENVTSMPVATNTLTNSSCAYFSGKHSTNSTISNNNVIQ